MITTKKMKSCIVRHMLRRVNDVKPLFQLGKEVFLWELVQLNVFKAENLGSSA